MHLQRQSLFLNGLRCAAINRSIPLAVTEYYGEHSKCSTWGHVMREYHFYFLDQQSQIQSTKIAHCADDLAALEFAQRLNAPADIEIWQSTRLVTRLNAEGAKERGVA